MDELYHYGRKGMKWYQNIFTKNKITVGRRTKSGRKMSREERKRLTAMQKGKIRAEKERERKAKILKSPTLLMKYRNEFTKKEIDEAMATFKWEAELSRLSQQELDRGRQYLNTAVSYMETGTKGYNSFARIYNSVNKDAKPLPIIESGGKKNR